MRSKLYVQCQSLEPAILYRSYDGIVTLQGPYDTSRMTVRGPVLPTRNSNT